MILVYAALALAGLYTLVACIIGNLKYKAPFALMFPAGMFGFFTGLVFVHLTATEFGVIYG